MEHFVYTYRYLLGEKGQLKQDIDLSLWKTREKAVRHAHGRLWDVDVYAVEYRTVGTTVFMLDKRSKLESFDGCDSLVYRKDNNGES